MVGDQNLYCQYNMISIDLKNAMKHYEARTGHRITYQQLAKQTGLSIATLQSLATRPQYNPRLSTISALCEALDCEPGDLLKRKSR